MIARCEYCRQLTDGLECRKCGAPLRNRYFDSPAVHVTTQRDPQMEGSALENYGKRTKIDEISSYPAWLSRSLVQWRLRG